MQYADECLRSGDLEGARAAVVEHIKTHPADPGGRMFMFQLLSLAGDWEKARIHLATLARLSPEAQMLSVVYNQAMEAEATRAEVFAGRKRMPVIRGSWAEGLADALQHYLNGDRTAGDDARNRAFDEAPDTPGTLDGECFDWISDSDSRFGPTFEAILHGRYGLIAFSEVKSLSSEGPRDLRDTVWYPVEIEFREGQSAAALLPARYPGSEALTDPLTRLGRSTDWCDGVAGKEGSGQHLLTLSSGEERGLLTLRSLQFD